MENALKGLYFAAGIALSCMIIGFGFIAMREAKNTASVSLNQMAEFRTNLFESGLRSYDNSIISGSELLNFTKYHFNTMQNTITGLRYIEIIGKETLHCECYEDARQAANENSKYYIEPWSAYQGTIICGPDGEIIGMKFQLVKG